MDKWIVALIGLLAALVGIGFAVRPAPLPEMTVPEFHSRKGNLEDGTRLVLRGRIRAQRVTGLVETEITFQNRVLDRFVIEEDGGGEAVDVWYDPGDEFAIPERGTPVHARGMVFRSIDPRGRTEKQLKMEGFEEAD